MIHWAVMKSPAKLQPSASRQVSTSQRGVHPKLGAVLEKRRQRPWLQPLHVPSIAAFAALQRIVGPAEHGLVLDSGCGTGESTRAIARALPDCLVVGVDKSAARLARTGARVFPHREGNTIWLRADLPTFWRLALEAGWHLRRHYLLYPNPWPKPGQLLRRWHAHPVFPSLLALGGRLEMRCNWDLYAQEFALAAGFFLGRKIVVSAPGDPVPISPFERKYAASGHALYSVVADCSGVK